MADVQFVEATRIYPGTDTPAVDSLDLHIEDGEFMVLVGPSGSGKTTALRMLAGLEEVDAGAVVIGGRDVTFVPPKDRDVAMVFQNYALYPYLTVAANIGFPLKIAKVRRSVRDARVPRQTATASRAEHELSVANEKRRDHGWKIGPRQRAVAVHEAHDAVHRRAQSCPACGTEAAPTLEDDKRAEIACDHG